MYTNSIIDDKDSDGFWLHGCCSWIIFVTSEGSVNDSMLTIDSSKFSISIAACSGSSVNIMFGFINSSLGESLVKLENIN